MDNLASDLCRAMTAEMKCAARRKGITLQEEFNQRCRMADSKMAWDDVVDKALVGRDTRTRTDSASLAEAAEAAAALLASRPERDSHPSH